VANKASFSVTEFHKDETVLFTLPHIDLSKRFDFGRCLSQLKCEVPKESQKETIYIFIKMINLSENRQDAFLALWQF